MAMRVTIIKPTSSIPRSLRSNLFKPTPFPSGIPPTAVGGSIKVQPTHQPIKPLRNTPDGSRGIIKVQPTHQPIKPLWNTPDGSRGIIKVQPTHQPIKPLWNTPDGSREEA